LFLRRGICANQVCQDQKEGRERANYRFNARWQRNARYAFADMPSETRAKEMIELMKRLMPP
jgi:hypothetical protein